MGVLAGYGCASIVCDLVEAMTFLRSLIRYRYKFGYRWSMAVKLARGEL